MPPSSLLFDNGLSDRLNEGLGNQQLSMGNVYAQNASPSATNPNTYFDPFPPSASLPHSLYSSSSSSSLRNDSGRLGQMDWRLASQTPTSRSSSSVTPDWRPMGDKHLSDSAFGNSPHEGGGRHSQNGFGHRQISMSTPSFSSAHEVECLTPQFETLRADLCLRLSPSISCPFSTLLRHRPIMFSSLESSSPPTSKLRSSFSRSSRSQMLRSERRLLMLFVPVALR